jgi:hypothetical protein
MKKRSERHLITLVASFGVLLASAAFTGETYCAEQEGTLIPGNAADHAEIRKLKARALEGMRRYMEVVRKNGKDPGYSDAEIRKCEFIVDTYLRKLSSISKGDNARVMAAAKDAVLALNKLNRETGERLIETDQREDLAMLIIKAAGAVGVGDGKADITEQWREW